MITFLLVNAEREISSIAMLVSYKGKKYKKSTGLSIPVKRWNKTKKRVKVTTDFLAGSNINDVLNTWESITLSVLENFRRHLSAPTPKEFFVEFDRLYYINKGGVPEYAFFDTFDTFLASKRLSKARIAKYDVLRRMLCRFELYSKQKLSVDGVTSNTLRAFEEFLKIEHTLWHEVDGVKSPKPKYSYIYEKHPESRVPLERGQNTMATIMKMLRCFFNKCVFDGVISVSPFRGYEAPQDKYGTPYYITIEERNQIYNHDLSKRPQLAIQRDIFIFQSVIGCRVSDLYSLKKSNVIDDAVEYIARKTKEDKAIYVRVPLNSVAKEILSRYNDCESDELFPFIAKQNYNEAIKNVFELVGITRMVTVVDKKTGEETQKKISELVSSQLARRTFIGNIYKKVRDPNLIGALSGHKEGSKAFARYRDIDEDIKKDLVKLIE